MHNILPHVYLSLAHDSANHEKKMIGKKQVEVKLDGVRVLTIIRGNKVEMFSRNGKQFHNFGHIISEIEQVIAQKSFHDSCIRRRSNECKLPRSYETGAQKRW